MATLFVHFSAIRAEGYRSLNEGQTVEFEVKQGPKGLQAENVVAMQARMPMPANRSPGHDPATRTHIALIRLSRDPDDRDALHLLRDANRSAIRATIKRWLGDYEYHHGAAEFAIMVHLARTARSYRSDRQDSLSWVAAVADEVCRSLSLAIANLRAFDGAAESASHSARERF